MSILARHAPPTAKQTRAFLALAEHRSFAKAAVVLGLNENTVRVAVKGFLRHCAWIACLLVAPV